MEATSIHFDLLLNEAVLAFIALLFIAGAMVVWVRSYFRSRQSGWLFMAGGMGVCILNSMLETTSLIWTDLGALLLFGGSMVVCRSMRRDSCSSKPTDSPASAKAPPGA